MDRKNILMIGVGVLLLVVVVIGVVLWVLMSEEERTDPTADGVGAFGDTSATSSELSGNFGDTWERGGSNGTTRRDGERARLWQVHPGPVSAATVYASTTNDANLHIIRFLERGTGHIFDHHADTQKTVRLSQNRFTSVQYAVWFPNDPDRFVLQYLDQTLENVRTYLGTVVTKSEADQREGSTHQVTGTLLEPQGTVSALAPAPQSGDLFYLVTTGETTEGKIRGADGAIRSLYRSPFTRAQAAWSSPATITLSSNASQHVPGAILSLSTRTGAERPLVYGEPGLTGIRSRDGEFLVYTTFRNQPPLTFVRSITEGTNSFVRYTTLPEKCVWGNVDTSTFFCAVPDDLLRSTDPDGWYQGRYFYEDNVWRFDAETGAEELLVSFRDLLGEGAEEPPDIIQPILSADDAILTFIDKRTGALWALDLTEEEEEDVEEEETDTP